MNTEQILMCVVALILGMLLANMLKSVCGCKVVEGQNFTPTDCVGKNCDVECGKCKGRCITGTCGCLELSRPGCIA